MSHDHAAHDGHGHRADGAGSARRHDHHQADHTFDVARVHERDYWEERYAGDAHVWSGRPNQPVVDELGALAPGRALDVAAGEGGDALWLAEHGWTVTALDVSANALAHGRALAAERGLGDRVTWVRADVRTWRTDARFDLVTSAYLHLPPDLRSAWLSDVARLVVPGGTLLVVNHDASDQHVVARPEAPELYASAAELAAELDPATWDVVTAETRARVATGGEGTPVTLHDAVLRARRR